MSIVENMAFDKYKSIEAIHKSALVEICQSPAHYRHQLTHPRQPSPALTFGSLAHTIVLEPEEYEQRYYVVSDEIRRGTKAWAEAEAKAGGREIVKTRDLERALAIRDAVVAHPKAREVLDACEMREASIFWDSVGANCKARADAMSVTNGIIVDLKTCENASPNAFARDIASYRYHWQAAMYVDGAAANANKPFLFVFIAVEKEPPYGVGVYLISESFLEIGRAEYLDAIKAVKNCEKTGKWPCYSDSAIELQAPLWMEKAANNLK